MRAACRNVSALPLAALARAPPLALRELRAPGAGVAALPDDLPDTLKVRLLHIILMFLEKTNHI